MAKKKQNQEQLVLKNDFLVGLTTRLYSSTFCRLLFTSISFYQHAEISTEISRLGYLKVFFIFLDLYTLFCRLPLARLLSTQFKNNCYWARSNTSGVHLRNDCLPLDMDPGANSSCSCSHFRC